MNMLQLLYPEVEQHINYTTIEEKFIWNLILFNMAYSWWGRSWTTLCIGKRKEIIKMNTMVDHELDILPEHLNVFAFWVPCCDVRYDFRIKTMFSSPLSPVVCRGLMSYLRYLCLLAHSGILHILCCVFVNCICFRLVLYCQFLWIVHFVMPRRYSITFICILLKMYIQIGAKVAIKKKN